MAVQPSIAHAAWAPSNSYGGTVSLPGLTGYPFTPSLALDGGQRPPVSRRGWILAGAIAAALLLWGDK